MDGGSHSDLTDFYLPVSHGDPPGKGFELSVLERGHSGYEIVPKRWGEELIIENNNKYCGKILTVVPKQYTSYHYHEKKDETFYVLSGRMVVYVGTKNHIETIVVLNEGDKYRLLPYTCHSIACMGEVPVRFIEFSTTDSPRDSYRVRFPGGNHA